MKRGSHLPPLAVAAVAGPGVVVLLVLALMGLLAWTPAVLGALIVMAGACALVYRHAKHLDALSTYVQELGRSGAARLGRPPHVGSPILSPGLEDALTEAAEERHRRRLELDAVIAGNEAIVENLPDPLIILDSRRHIVRANPAAEELFGTGIAGRDLTEVLRAPALLDTIDAVLEGEEKMVLDFSIPGPVQRTFNARAARLPSTTREGAVAILSLHDLTSLKRAEQLRADFVANASHELRTPLSSLLGFIETLRGPAREDEEARLRFLTIMHDQALRMARLVEDLLSLSRIEMKEHTPPTGASDLSRLLRSVANGLEIPARAKSMHIVVEAGELPPVTGDSDELTQVFQNLMDNAIKYGRAGTEVKVRATADPAAGQRLDGKAVVVSVADQGEGISREHVPRLTERFYRVDRARSRQLGGTGLGLAIVKHVVNRHRGALEVSSVEGEGSTFTVYLPVAPTASAAEAEAVSRDESDMAAEPPPQRKAMKA